MRNAIERTICKLFGRRVLRACHYGEHLGFVALAGAETFNAHAAIWYVSLILLATGVFSVIYDRVTGV